jgi:hypothetical protein
LSGKKVPDPAMPVIGYLSVQSADDDKNLIVPFLQGLKETGHVEAIPLAAAMAARSRQVCGAIEPKAGATASRGGGVSREQQRRRRRQITNSQKSDLKSRVP